MIALKAATISKRSENWWLPAHSPTRPQRWQNRVTHTQSTHRTTFLDTEHSGKVLQLERAGKNPEPHHRSYPMRCRQSHQILSTTHSVAFKIYPNHFSDTATCLMQNSSPEGSLVHASDVNLTTAPHTLLQCPSGHIKSIIERAPY